MFLSLGSTHDHDFTSPRPASSWAKPKEQPEPIRNEGARRSVETDLSRAQTGLVWVWTPAYLDLPTMQLCCAFSLVNTNQSCTRLCIVFQDLGDSGPMQRLGFMSPSCPLLVRSRCWSSTGFFVFIHPGFMAPKHDFPHPVFRNAWQNMCYSIYSVMMFVFFPGSLNPRFHWLKSSLM